MRAWMHWAVPHLGMGGGGGWGFNPGTEFVGCWGSSRTCILRRQRRARVGRVVVAGPVVIAIPVIVVGDARWREQEQEQRQNQEVAAPGSGGLHDVCEM